MVKPVSKGKTTGNKGTSRVLLRLYMVSLKVLDESMTIHGGNTKKVWINYSTT